MSSKRIDELRQLLVRKRLIDPSQLEACVSQLSPGSPPAELLRILESKHLLTTFQVMRLEKGETDDLVLGRYKLMYRNASGSFARVYRAMSIDDATMLGVKVLRKRWAEDPKSVALFHREAELGKSLVHKNIVPIHEIGNQREFHFFTMDFIVGGNLRDFINIRKKLSPVEATRYVLDMSEGLAYALRQGFTHRDLKMTNVLMDTAGTAKLIDFGLAGHEGISGSSSGDGVQRALEYATLEKSTNAPSDDPRSDLYFLGTIYYELLTGMPPYPRTRSREERKDFSRYQNVRPLRSVDPNVPRCVTDLVERLMNLSPDQRYQSPAEVIVDVKAALSQLERSTPPVEQIEKEKPLERNATQRTLPTVMCIERRAKQQDVLRDYLSKRGFRVLVLSDLQRGLGRLTTNPPDCVVLMGGSIGDGIIEAYQQAVRLGEEKSIVSVAVLSEKQGESKTKLEQSHTSRVLVEPITLRELRREIHYAFQRRLHDAKE